ncbi:halocyanin domain-containing protein [Halorubellus sp. JP-L1]|uniref:halocyanin domain-containing protein n=1 Tax=Halorubellus sp. JP-L1 TaxID=2715753 RepID=UPI0014092C87|nr:halocyanin domain-containing protein [Halorubellus sp. JP-L1]NHN40656.1 halocyanin domain-containing protein [Halorubellus sp. JP-L1]
MSDDPVRRRTVLRTLGASAAAGTIGLAGCSGPSDGNGEGNDGGAENGDGAGDATETDAGDTETDGDGDETGTDGNGGDGVAGSEYPDLDEWLTTESVGAAAPNYDGSVVDERDADALEIAVGAGENGLAFDPPAVVVSTGTTVTWEWTGEGGAHNVEAEPGEQIDASDYEFSSGDPVESDSETFEQTMDSAGVALYHCEPHLSVGMKGGVAVE